MAKSVAKTEGGELIETCRSCRFWRNSVPEQYVYGFCHRRAPTTEMSITAGKAQWGGVEVRIHDTRRPRWPNTHEKDWCGDYAYRPGEPLPEPDTRDDGDRNRD
jgi:hypothetical protein